ncbi:MAG: YitT family protein [Christensenellales bacterium]
MTLAKKILRILPAMFLYGLGVYFTMQADIGLAPWEAFHAGCSRVMGISFGDFVLLAGLVILLLDVLLKEKVGLGTVINILLVGKVVDLLEALQLIPKAQHMVSGIAVLFIGQVFICFATYLYISAGLGSGPRDSLMVAIGKRLPKVPIGAVRGLLEGTVLLIGWSLGAKVGLGTVIAVASISVIMQYTFRIMRFQVREVRHESIADTLLSLRKARAEQDA